MTLTEQPALQRADATIAAYRAAVEAGDHEAFVATLAPDVVLHSPITARTVFRGHGQLRTLMRHVFTSIDGIAFFEEVGDATTRALFSRARIGRQEVEEATLLRLDDEGRIAEIRLWFRPLPGLTALMGTLGPKLAREGGRGKAVVVVGMTGPLVRMTRFGDRAAVKLVRPAG